MNISKLFHKKSYTKKNTGNFKMTKGVVNIKRPVNFSDLREDIQSLFIEQYDYEEQQVSELSNCYVTYNGIVLSNFKYVKQCFYSPATYKKKYYLWALKRWFYSKVTRWGRANTIKLSSRPAAIIHQPYINYFHWTIESLMRLMVLEKTKKEYKLFVPGNLAAIKYIKNSLDILGADYEVVGNASEKDMVVPNLLLPDMVWWGNRYNPEILLMLALRFAKAIPQKGIKPLGHEKVFIIREQGRRKIANANEVKQAIAQRGFYVVDFEGKTLQEQISTMMSAKIVVAQHGAALTNILYMPSGGKVVEIYVDPAENNYQFDDSYYILASALGHSYYSFISKKANKEADFFTSDHFINTELLADMVAAL